MCADWREHKRIRTHRDQVATNVRVKLLPSEDREEPAELSVDKAIEGASRIALALQMMRRLTIRHSAASDVADEEAALDPAIILSDWQPDERKALLERPLFGCRISCCRATVDASQSRYAVSGSKTASVC